MPKIEVSNGDLADKISILEIKRNKIHNFNQLINIENELKILKNEFNKFKNIQNAMKVYDSIFEINLTIWDLMQQIFDKKYKDMREFNIIALETVEANKRRSWLKREFDVLTKSEIMEEKSYFEG